MNLADVPPFPSTPLDACGLAVIALFVLLLVGSIVGSISRSSRPRE